MYMFCMIWFRIVVSDRWCQVELSFSLGWILRILLHQNSHLKSSHWSRCQVLKSMNAKNWTRKSVVDRNDDNELVISRFYWTFEIVDVVFVEQHGSHLLIQPYWEKRIEICRDGILWKSKSIPSPGYGNVNWQMCQCLDALTAWSPFDRRPYGSLYCSAYALWFNSSKSCPIVHQSVWK